MRKYFYLQKGKVVGPIDIKDLQLEIDLGRLSVFDLIYRDDEKKWKPLGEFRELEAFLNQKSDINNLEDSKGDEFLIEDEPAVESVKETSWVVLKARLQPGKKDEYDLKTSGPFSTQQVKKMISAGDLEYQDYAWNESLAEWTKVSQLEELFVSNPIQQKADDSIFVIDEFVEKLESPKSSGEELLGSVKVVDKHPVEKQEVPEEAIAIEEQEEKIQKIVKIRSVEKKNLKQAENSKPEKLRKPAIEFDEYEKENFKFRLMQGIFASLIIGSIVGFAIMVSHERLPEMVSTWVKNQWQSVSLFAEDDGEKETKVVPIKKPKKQAKAKAKPKAEVAKKIQTAPPPPPVAPPVQKPIQKPPKIASFIKIETEGLSTKSPRVVIKTDATHHYPTSWLITGAAGQILARPSYHREWEQKIPVGGSRDLNLTKYYLGRGWYTVRAQIGTKTALKTFFYGSKKGFKSKVRDYRKFIAAFHQGEKESLYFNGKKLIEAGTTAQDLLKSRKLAPRQKQRTVTLALKNLSAVRRMVRSQLKQKNKNLWTVYWIQLRDLESEAKDLVQAAHKQPKSTRVKRQVRKFSKNANKWLSKINELSVAR